METRNENLTGTEYVLITTGPATVSIEVTRRPLLSFAYAVVASSQPASSLIGHFIDQLTSFKLGEGDMLYARSTGNSSILIITETLP